MEPLTREQITAEPAGSRLDAWIAEYVLGYVLRPADPWNGSIVTRRTTRWERPDGLCYRPRPGLRESGIGNPPLPHYSTDIAAAWEVVRHVKGLTTNVSVHVCDNSRGRPRAFCDVDGLGGLLSRGEGEAVPEAVCKAALLAVISGAKAGG